jgi:hypothetical protein
MSAFGEGEHQIVKLQTAVESSLNDLLLSPRRKAYQPK